MRELDQCTHLNCFLVFQQPFQQTTLIFVFNGRFFHGSLFNGSFFQGSHKGASNQDRANSQARCERGPGGRARVTIFARTESEVKQRPLIVLSLRRGEWRGVLAPALLSPHGSSWASRRTQAPLPAPLNHAPAARAVPPRHAISGEAGRDLQTDDSAATSHAPRVADPRRCPWLRPTAGHLPSHSKDAHKRALASQGQYQKGPGGR